MLKKLLTLIFFSIILVSVTPLIGEAATTTIKYVKISEGSLNVRESASIDAAIVSSLPNEAKVTVISEANGWSEITTNELKGFVSSEFLYTKTNPIITSKTTTSKTVYQNKAITIAKSYLGVKYKWGGTTPRGFDCSGLVRFSFGKAGVSLPRTAADMQKKGKSVSSKSLHKGDLLFFAKYKGARPSHVAIYIGGGKMIHSASRGVSISSISESYWKQRFIGAKRI